MGIFPGKRFTGNTRTKSFFEIHQSILKSINGKKKSILSISKSAEIHWNTANNYLKAMEKMGLVEERIALKNNRIYGLTKIGRQLAKQNEQKKG